MITTQSNAENRSKRRMGPGAHAKCVFTSGEIKETAKGTKFIEIWFANQSGETQKKAIFFPTGTPTPKEGESLVDAKARELNAFTGACFDTLIAFYDPQDSIISGDTVDSFAKKFLDKLKNAKGFCNLMVQYTTDYKYTEFPKYDWIERYQENSPVTLRISDSLRLVKKGERKEDSGSAPGPGRYF